MMRLVFLVEGDTEIILINQHVIPYLYQSGFYIPMQSQKIITHRQLNKKGGNISYEYLKNDINRILAQGNVIITTFLDFFRLPTNFPGYSTNANDISRIEQNMHEDFNLNPHLIPYIQKHEMEALMFCCNDGFEFVVDDNKAINSLNQIIAKYENPEDINTNPNGAPSKRMQAIFNYNKTVDSELIFAEIGIERMLEKCPGFTAWVHKIICALQESKR